MKKLIKKLASGIGIAVFVIASTITPTMASDADPTFRIIEDETEDFTRIMRISKTVNSTEYDMPLKERYNILYVNGTAYPETKIIVKNNRSLVPLRVVSENMSYDVNWDSASKQAIVSLGDKSICFAIGSDNANVNNNLVRLEAAPEIINGSTYVPIRTIADCMGAEISYYMIDASDNGNEYRPTPAPAIVAIEQNTVEAGYSVDEAAEIIKNEVTKVINDNNVNLSKLGYALDINKTDDIGRYYVFNVYKSEKTEVKNRVLFDKTNGKTYSLHPGHSLTWYSVIEGCSIAASVGVFAG